MFFEDEFNPFDEAQENFDATELGIPSENDPALGFWETTPDEDA